MDRETINIALPLITNVVVDDVRLTVELSDGRTITIPIVWYPRLSHGTADERNIWELIGAGYGIHWPQLDEDLSVEGFLAGRRSGESPKSFQKWLDNRKAR